MSEFKVTMRVENGVWGTETDVPTLQQLVRQNHADAVNATTRLLDARQLKRRTNARLEDLCTLIDETLARS